MSEKKSLPLFPPFSFFFFFSSSSLVSQTVDVNPRVVLRQHQGGCPELHSWLVVAGRVEMLHGGHAAEQFSFGLAVIRLSPHRVLRVADTTQRRTGTWVGRKKKKRKAQNEEEQRERELARAGRKESKKEVDLFFFCFLFFCFLRDKSNFKVHRKRRTDRPGTTRW
jgi:hypothetical protein